MNNHPIIDIYILEPFYPPPPVSFDFFLHYIPLKTLPQTPPNSAYLAPYRILNHENYAYQNRLHMMTIGVYTSCKYP